MAQSWSTAKHQFKKRKTKTKTGRIWKTRSPYYASGVGGAKRCGGGFKVIILMGAGEGGKPQGEDLFLRGGVDISLHHEGCSHEVILLFWSFIEVLPDIVKAFIGYLFTLYYCCFISIYLLRLSISSFEMYITYICSVTPVSSFWDNASNFA